MLTLASGPYGLVDVVDGVGRPGRWLLQALLMTLLAAGFFVAAQRSADKRFAWLLSSSVAAGFAIAASCNLIGATTTPAVPVAGVVIFIAVMLLLTRGLTRHPPCR